MGVADSWELPDPDPQFVPSWWLAQLDSYQGPDSAPFEIVWTD